MLLTATKLKTSVEGLLAEWEKLAVRARKIELQRLADCLREQAKFDKACAPINLAARKKLDPIEAEMKVLAGQIDREMKTSISTDGKTATVPQVETEKAICELKDNGHRMIAPAAFFEETPVGLRTSSFWSCVEILIGKAEKFLPADAMERLAAREPKWSVKTRLKK